MKHCCISCIVLGLCVSAAAALAVGGGGGGSLPSCSADQWDCSGWSQCSASGTQTRICSLTYDCPTADTPRPAERQSCTPPPQPPPAAEPAAERGAPQIATCTEDRWACSAWSARCDSYGREQRSCELAFDCPAAATPPPAESRPCRKLQCGDKPTLRERIACRLNLAPAGAARDLELQYLPEACRVKTGGEQTECVKLYKSFQPCWGAREGAERFSCARNVLKLGPVVADAVTSCRANEGAAQALCKTQLKEKVLYLIAFRFYDLETRAEELGNRGADLHTIADFETTIELRKQAWDKAATNAERREIILDVRKAWRDFVNTVKSQVK